MDKIVRPIVEVEIPHWFYRFEEIYADLRDARPANLSSKQLYKLRRKAARILREETVRDNE